MNITIDKADKVFSEYIRLRDKRCVRCKKLGHGSNGINGLQNSHYFGRRNECTRFDPENCDSLCMGCHQRWGSEDKESYREFKIAQLGEKGFKDLRTRSQMVCKKDRKLSYLVAKKLLESL